MQQDVALGDRLEQAALVDEGRQRALLELRELQIGPFDLIVDCVDPVHVDRAGQAIHVRFVELEIVHQVIGDRFRAGIGDFDAHRAREAAPAQFVAQREREVLDIFLVDEQLAVAGDAELVGAGHAHAGEQLVDELVQDARQKDEVVRFFGDFVGQAHDARQRARRAQQGHVALAPECVAAFERNREVEALVEDARERMRWIEAERRQHRHHFVLEVTLQPAGLLGRPLVARDEADAFAVEFRQQRVVPECVLRADEFEHACANACEQLGRRCAVRAGLGVAEGDVVAQHGDLDFEEFVEVGIRDAQEAHALEQRHRLVLCLREHAEIEFELGEFAVEVERGVAQVARLGMNLGVRLGGCRGARLAVGAAHGLRGDGGFFGTHWTSSDKGSNASRRSREKTQENVLPTPSSLSISSRA